MQRKGPPLNAGNSQPTLLAIDVVRKKTSSTQDEDPSQTLAQRGLRVKVECSVRMMIGRKLHKAKDSYTALVNTILSIQENDGE